MESESIFEQLKNAFQAEKAAGINAAIQLKLSGDQAGEYFVKIKDKAISGGKGVVEKPRITLSASTKDLADIFLGRLDPMSAYFQGKLVIQGDLGFAMQLAGLFKRG